VEFGLNRLIAQAAVVDASSCCIAELSPLDIAACYADYHVYNAVNQKLQSLPPEDDKKKKKKPAKNVVVKPRHGADIYRRKLAGASAPPSAVRLAIHYSSIIHEDGKYLFV